MTTATTKRCAKCKTIKAVSEFHRHSKNADGLQAYCKPCILYANREATFRRRAKDYGYEPIVEKFEIIQLIHRDGDGCARCGQEWNEFDHVVPVRVGGQHVLSNVQLLCRRCHATKSEWDRVKEQIISGGITPTIFGW